jgi:hypothetical protein
VSDPSNRQVGGDHYKSMAIQPTEYIEKNGIGFCAGNVIKYVSRYKSKGGKQDLEKAIHFLEFLIKYEFESEQDQVVFDKLRAEADELERKVCEKESAKASKDFEKTERTSSRLPQCNYAVLVKQVGCDSAVIYPDGSGFGDALDCYNEHVRIYADGCVSLLAILNGRVKVVNPSEYANVLGKDRTTLAKYLAELGWCETVSLEVHNAFSQSGFDGVVDATRWMNHDEHDYTSEIVSDVKEFLNQIAT